jgi:hypothetical protein
MAGQILSEIRCMAGPRFGLLLCVVGWSSRANPTNKSTTQTLWVCLCGCCCDTGPPNRKGTRDTPETSNNRQKKLHDWKHFRRNQMHGWMQVWVVGLCCGLALPGQPPTTINNPTIMGLRMFLLLGPGPPNPKGPRAPP